MSNWESVPFSELYLVPSRNGLTRPSAVRGSGFPFINMGELFANDRIFDIDMELVELNAREQKEAIVKDGDLLFARQSLVFEGAGKCSIVVKLKKTTAFESHLIRVRLNPAVADSVFYYYYFNSSFKPIRPIVQQCAQAGVRGSDLDKLKVLHPNVKEQRRIAAILSAYDELIENNNKRIALLEKAVQELYKEWFVRFRFPGHENTEFENGLPKGWGRRKIDTYYKTCSGGTPSRSHFEYYENGIYPWVKTGEIKDSVIIDAEEYITEDAIRNSSAKLLPEKSVVMAMYGVNIGMLSYFDRQMACNQACCVFADKRGFSSKHYLYQYLFSIREYLLLISFGAAQQNLSQDLIKKVKITMPTDELVKSFEEKVDVFYSSIRALLYANQNLAKQRDLLLPRLMSGKLEV